jgi:hypothetical protein
VCVVGLVGGCVQWRRRRTHTHTHTHTHTNTHTHTTHTHTHTPAAEALTAALPSSLPVEAYR